MPSAPPFSSPASRRQAVWVAAAVLLGVCAAIAAVHDRPVVDEWAHFAQVQEFLRGNYKPLEALTMLPGYHATIAAAGKLAHDESLGFARLATLAFGILAIPAFAGIRRAVAPGEDPVVPTLQFVFFPLLFPFCFLVYTDVPSLALVLWALRASLAGRDVAAGAIGIVALLFRQTNVVWIGLIALWRLIEICSRHESWSARGRAALALWPYALNAAAFLGYWVWNGAIALSRFNESMHPDFSLHSGNLFFMLFVAAVFLAPLHAVWIPRYIAAARARPVLWLLPLALLALYAATFAVDHIANLFGMEYYLRNFILVYVKDHPWAHLGLGIVAAIAACGLYGVRWQRASFALVLPVSAAFVCLFWLIEQRYYLVPFALLFALRTTEDRRAEALTLALWIPVALAFLYGMVNFEFFL